MMRALLVMVMLCWGASEARGMSVEGVAVAGGWLRGELPQGAGVRARGGARMVVCRGEFLAGLPSNLAGAITVEIKERDNEILHSAEMMVARRDYKETHIEGLPPSKVEPDEEALARIARESKSLREARAVVDCSRRPTFPLHRPADGRISGIYGSRRVLNGQPRSPHFGLDIAAPEGADVRAADDGIVTLAHKDMFFTGDTIIISHGMGFFTLYSHLSAIFVKEGEEVMRGEVIGAVGQSGRATGNHLHFATYLKRLALDPALVTELSPQDYLIAITPSPSLPEYQKYELMKEKETR